MTRNKSHRHHMTDGQLLASAWSELIGTPRVIHPGGSSSVRTAPFSARYRGLCDRCGRWINRGDQIRYHRDFSGPVHSGCRASEVASTGVYTGGVTRRSRTPPLCPECRTEHVGGCW